MNQNLYKLSPNSQQPQQSPPQNQPQMIHTDNTKQLYILHDDTNQLMRNINTLIHLQPVVIFFQLVTQNEHNNPSNPSQNPPNSNPSLFQSDKKNAIIQQQNIVPNIQQEGQGEKSQNGQEINNENNEEEQIKSDNGQEEIKSSNEQQEEQQSIMKSSRRQGQSPKQEEGQRSGQQQRSGRQEQQQRSGEQGRKQQPMGKKCFNKLCQSKKIYKKLRSKVQHAKYRFLCRPCYQSYVNNDFCQFCQQIYSSTGNAEDDDQWIGCDQCNRWNHIDCEIKYRNKNIHQIKDQDDTPYLCLTCTYKAKEKYHQQNKQKTKRQTPIEDIKTPKPKPDITKQQRLPIFNRKIQSLPSLEYFLQNYNFRLWINQNLIKDDLQLLRQTSKKTPDDGKRTTKKLKLD